MDLPQLRPSQPRAMEAELLEGSLSGNLGLLKKALAMPGTQINTADNEGRMALFIAAREGKEEAVGILLAAGADVGAAAARDGDSALIIAAAEGHVRVVGLLLAAGAVAQQTNGKGWSPCMYAAYYGHLDVVQLLLDWDANAGWIDSRCEQGRTALFRAAQQGHTPVLALLLHSGASPDTPTNDGTSPLSAAARWGHAVAVGLLLEAGADVDSVNEDGCCPLSEAVEADHIEVVALLLERGAAVLARADADTGAGAGTGDVGTDSGTDTGAGADAGAWAGPEVMAVWVADTDSPSKQPPCVAYATLLSEQNSSARTGTREGAVVRAGGQAPSYSSLSPSTPIRPRRHPSSLLLSARSAGVAELLQRAVQRAVFSEHLAAMGERAEGDEGGKWVGGEVEGLEEIQGEGGTVNISGYDSSPLCKLPKRKVAGVGAESTAGEFTGESGNVPLSASELQTLRGMVLQPSPPSLAHDSATLTFLRQFAGQALLAQSQYRVIKSDTLLSGYFRALQKYLSCAVAAAHTIASGFVADDRLSTAEGVMQGVEVAAQALPFGASLVANLGRFLLSIPMKRDRERTIRSIITFFPSADSQKFVEILARQQTVMMAGEIREVGNAKKGEKGLLSRLMCTAEWMQPVEMSPVQGFACGHAARLLDFFMRCPAPYAVEMQHISALLAESSGLGVEEVQRREEAGEGAGDGGVGAENGLDLDLPSDLGDVDESAGETKESSQGNRERAGECATEIAVREYADKEETAARIALLEQQLSGREKEREQERERGQEDQRRWGELEEVKKKLAGLKNLEAVNAMFGGMGGGLVQGQGKESLRAHIDEHYKRQEATQEGNEKAIRELITHVQLLQENLPEGGVGGTLVGGGGGTGVGMGAGGVGVGGGCEEPMGAWVGGRVSYTEDGAKPRQWQGSGVGVSVVAGTGGAGAGVRGSPTAPTKPNKPGRVSNSTSLSAPPFPSHYPSHSADVVGEGGGCCVVT